MVLVEPKFMDLIFAQNLASERFDPTAVERKRGLSDGDSSAILVDPRRGVKHWRSHQLLIPKYDTPVIHIEASAKTNRRNRVSASIPSEKYKLAGVVRFKGR